MLRTFEMSLVFSSSGSGSSQVEPSQLNMGLDATKHVFEVSDKVRLKPICSATETS